MREPTLGDLLVTGNDPDALLRRCAIGSIADLGRVEGSLSGPLHAACSGCGAHMEVDVDVVTLVLRALGAVPAELDRDVDALASRYGWDLAVIEALPDGRRRRLAALARTSP